MARFAHRGALALTDDGARTTPDGPLQTIAQREERFRLLVESVKDYGIFMLSPTGHVASWNIGAERLKGYRADEIIGKHFSIFYPQSDVDAGKCERELESAAEEGRFIDEDWRVRKDGSLFWANVTITALRDPDGTLVGFAKVTRDLTERKETEEQLRRLAAEKAALAEKQHTQQFQERFLAVLGHDLRNPLAAVEMGAALLRRQRPDDANVIRILDRIDSSTGRMTRMIEQILDLTRSRLSGGLTVDRRELDLRSVVAATIDELSTAKPGRVITLLASEPQLGSWDRDRLEQVFSNLIGNAVQHGRAGAPVSVSVEPCGNGDVCVAVHNEGVPIPEDLQSKLFDPFRRGDRDSRTAATAGLGLGLYISREIVRAHGGELTVRSNDVEGTTFRVSLPRSGAIR